jgi:hypothetical protein
VYVEEKERSVHLVECIVLADVMYLLPNDASDHHGGPWIATCIEAERIEQLAHRYSKEQGGEVTRGVAIAKMLGSS